MSPAVRDADLAADGDAILALNNGAVPAVNMLDRTEFLALAALGTVRVATRPDLRVAGFILTMVPGAPYNSQNYRWFSARYTDFFYIDRVVVDGRTRGGGVGRALYDDTIRRAAEGRHPRVCSEVNIRPPNPQSMAFHEALGFVAIDEHFNDAEGKLVAMMVRELVAAA